MGSSTRTLAALGLALLLALPLPGAELAQVTQVTVDEFLNAWGPDHPAWIALEDDLGRARAAQIEASLWENPELLWNHEAPGDDLRETILALSWRPPLDGRRSLAVDAAEAGVQAARSELAARRLERELEMRRVFATWAVAHQRVERLELRAETLDRLLERTRHRRDEGETSGLQARRLELARLKLEGELVDAETIRNATRSAARTWNPGVAPDAVPVIPRLPELPPSPRDPGSHPLLQALGAELEQAQLEGKLARRIFRFPDLTLGVQRVDDGPQRLEGATYGLTWSLPLFDRNQADRAAAEAAAESLKARLRWTTRDLERRDETTRAAYARLRRAASSARALLADLDRMVESATTAFQLGEGDLTDLLDTLRAAAEAEDTALDLHAEALAAHRRWLRLQPTTPGDMP